EPMSADGFPGSVHSGFFSALTALLPRVVQAVNQQRVGPAADKPLLITGHSKGGAVAALMAWQMQALAHLPVKVVTFAAAKPGEAVFAAAYNSQIDHTRYEYGNDIVPHLPPSQEGFLNVLRNLPVIGAKFARLPRFDYAPVGVLRYIDQTGRV